VPNNWRTDLDDHIAADRDGTAVSREGKRPVYRNDENCLQFGHEMPSQCEQQTLNFCTTLIVLLLRHEVCGKNAYDSRCISL
jgi:hypothetical protein